MAHSAALLSIFRFRATSRRSRAAIFHTERFSFSLGCWFARRTKNLDDTKKYFIFTLSIRRYGDPVFDIPSPGSPPLPTARLPNTRSPPIKPTSSHKSGSYKNHSCNVDTHHTIAIHSHTHTIVRGESAPRTYIYIVVVWSVVNSPANTMSAGMPELGSKISLISKADIRYEGRLFTVDPAECTIALANGKPKKY